MKLQRIKRILIISIIFTVSIHVFSQSNCNIQHEYNHIFKIDRKMYGKRETFQRIVQKPDSGSCFSKLIANNIRHFSYLLANFGQTMSYEEMASFKDSVRLQKAFIQSLKDDTTFNKIMLKLEHKVLNNREFTPDTTSIENLMNIASKYFMIFDINDKGHYKGQVCSGTNGIKETEENRKPHIEAFCFSSILNNYRGEKFDMYNEFVKAIKQLYKINLGLEEKDKLLRAQGAMFMYMSTNTKLKEMLLNEYEKKKDYLPFVLK